MKVVVLHSEIVAASKDEADVLVQVELVSKVLTNLGYRVHVLPFSMNLAAVAARLQQIHPVLVFNLVETVNGTGSLIHVAPALLDHLRMNYTGARTDAVFITSNKILAKKMMKAAGIPTPAWFEVGEAMDNGPVPSGTYVIKSLWEHASVGLDEDSVITAGEKQNLIFEMEARKEQLGGSCFAEAYVDGREFNLSLLTAGQGGSIVFPPAEIRFDHYPAGKKKVVGYRAKWETESFEYLNTPRCFEFAAEDQPLLTQLTAIAKECWRLFGLRGYARVDFRVDQAGKPWVLEVNTNPCLSPDAGFVAASQRASLTIQTVLQNIINDAISIPLV
jgi:D-alanine-D-alanine ligase